MKKIKSFLSSHQFALFLTCFSFVVFSWPFLLMINITAKPKFVYYYLFISWGFLIVALFFMARSYSPDPSEKDQEEKERG